MGEAAKTASLPLWNMPAGGRQGRTVGGGFTSLALLPIKIIGLARLKGGGRQQGSMFAPPGGILCSFYPHDPADSVPAGSENSGFGF